MEGDYSLSAILDFPSKGPEKYAYFREVIWDQRTLSAAKSDLSETVAMTEWKGKVKT